jgi:5'(3')-deoxyribonucleotidase
LTDKRQLFVDLDGVLADFDAHYESISGMRPDRSAEPPDFWYQINKTPTFFRDLPIMPGARDLWNRISVRLRHPLAAGIFHEAPIVLSGVPDKVPQAAAQKRAWVAEHFGSDIAVLTCKSEDKCLHGNPGDVLIDDWPKYQHLWEDMGGVFILHTSIDDTVRAFDELLAEQALS